MHRLDHAVSVYRSIERTAAATASAAMLLLTAAALDDDHPKNAASASPSEDKPALVDCSSKVRIAVKTGDTILKITRSMGVQDPYNPYDRINVDVAKGGGGEQNLPIEQFDPHTLMPGDAIVITDYSNRCTLDSSQAR